MRGEVSEEELGARYTEEAEALAEAGADGPIFETLSDVAEAMGAKSQCAAGELVDAVGLDLRRIQASGRFANGTGAWELSPPVVLAQADHVIEAVRAARRRDAHGGLNKLSSVALG